MSVRGTLEALPALGGEPAGYLLTRCALALDGAVRVDPSLVGLRVLVAGVFSERTARAACDGAGLPVLEVAWIAPVSDPEVERDALSFGTDGSFLSRSHETILTRSGLLYSRTTRGPLPGREILTRFPRVIAPDVVASLWAARDALPEGASDRPCVFGSFLGVATESGRRRFRVDPSDPRDPAARLLQRLVRAVYAVDDEHSVALLTVGSLSGRFMVLTRRDRAGYRILSEDALLRGRPAA